MEHSKNIHIATELDTRHNQDLVAGFEQYRNDADSYSGLMRLGPDTREAYDQLSTNTDVAMGRTVTGLYVPVTARNGITNTFSIDVVSENTQIGFAPKAHITGTEDFSEVYFPTQQLLSQDTVLAILNGDPSFNERIQREIQLSSDDLLKESGLPEYMLFSQYSVGEMAQHLKYTRPADVRVEDGLVVTADREKIVQLLDSIKELHVSVFESQTLQTGYYGGLSEEEVESFVHDEDFIPIIAYDDTTLEVQLLTLFSPNFTNFGSIQWINQSAVESYMSRDKEFGSSNLVLPLVTTSKMRGLGLMKHAVRKAAEETIYKTQCDNVSVLYECNGLSVGFSPKIIHSAIIAMGGVHKASTVEVTSYGR